MNKLFRICSLAVFLAVCPLICPPFALAQEPQPLNESEKREILLRLEELRVLKMELEIERKYIERDQAQDQREQALLKKELGNEVRARELAEKELALAKEQAAHYRQAYEAVIKKGSIGCTIKKIFTLGIARCR